MKKTAKKMLTELVTKHKIPKETLAGKFGVSVRTFDRWASGEIVPKTIIQKYIGLLYAKYSIKKGGMA